MTGKTGSHYASRATPQKQIEIESHTIFTGVGVGKSLQFPRRRPRPQVHFSVEGFE
jgi:hypothetical protein